MVFWQRFNPEEFDFEVDENELAWHRITADEAIEVIWNGFNVYRNRDKGYRRGYQIVAKPTAAGSETDRLRKTERPSSSEDWLGCMTRKSIAEAEIIRKLVDADNPDAWEAPITVSPSHSPRPEWYGRRTHIELAAKFYVLSVLHRLGAEANLTYAQPDNVDIAAVLQSGEALTIDVKTLTGTSQWPVENFSAKKYHFVVFVCFEREWRDPQIVPEVYIWSSQRLKAFIAQENATFLSLEAVALKLDPRAAWEQFLTKPQPNSKPS